MILGLKRYSKILVWFLFGQFQLYSGRFKREKNLFIFFCSQIIKYGWELKHGELDEHTFAKYETDENEEERENGSYFSKLDLCIGSKFKSSNTCRWDVACFFFSLAFRDGWGGAIKNIVLQ